MNKKSIKKAKPFLWLILLVFSVQTNAQQKIISGIVTDINDQPLFGVTVKAKNTNNVTFTDDLGEFTITTTNKNSILEFSYMGFVTKEEKFNKKEFANIQLIENVDILSEIVLIGYGSQNKEDLTGSVGSISSENIKNQPVVRVEGALNGRVSGVQVSANSGAPGGNNSIRIRGANSIKGNNQPLVVIDDVIGADMQLISAEDIKSIEVLKDASSTAIYGSRGANGVIIITTKSGKKDDLNISFNSFVSMSTLPKKVDYLNAGQFAELYNEYDRELNFVPGTYTSPFSQNQIDDFYKTGGTNWEDSLFRTALSKNYKIGISGAGKQINYYLSGEYLDQEGILINSGYERYNLRSKFKINLHKKLKLDVNLVSSTQKGLNNADVGHQLGAIGRLPQWSPIESIWTTENVLYNNTPNYGAVSGNPVGLQNAYETKNTTKVFLPSVSLNYNISPGFTAKAFGSIENTHTNVTYFENNQLLEGGTNAVSRASVNNIVKNRQQFNLILDYNKIIEEHTFQATGIYEQGNYIEEGAIASANGINSPTLKYYNLLLSQSQTASSYYYDEYYNSLALRLNYILKDKYLFTATARRDGVSKFKGDNQYSIFPSAAVGWKLSEEPFIKKLDFFDELKLRSSIGISGSHAVGSYGTLPYFIQNGETNYSPDGPGTQAETGLGIGAPGNLDLKWETTKQFDIGLDLAVLNNRIGIELDYYNKITSDLLIDTKLAHYAGGGNILRNVGEIRNSGFEISLNTNLYNKSKFSWDLSFNVSANRNIVENLGEEPMILPDTRYADSDTPITVIKEGEALGTFYGYNYLGVWKSNEAAEAALYGNVPGDAKYEDIDGNKEINSDDLKIIGGAQPDFIYGINNSFNIGDFNINILVQGVQGGQTFNGMYQKSIGLFGQSRAFTSPDLYNRWSPTNEDTNIPAFSTSSRNLPNSSRWLQDASYLRLRNINIAYNLPNSLASKIKISDLQIYLNTENLYTFSNYKGYNPDASSAGRSQGGGSNTDVDQNIDTGAYPSPRTFTVGLKLKF